MTQPAAKKPSSRLIDFLIIGLLVFLTSQYLFPRFFGGEKQDAVPQGVVLTMADATLIPGQNPMLVLQNNLRTPLVIADSCPLPPARIVYKGKQGAPVEEHIDPGAPVVACGSGAVHIEPGMSASLNLGAWKYVSFSQEGHYEIRVFPETESGGVVIQYPTSVDAYVVAQNVLGKAYTTFIIKPFLNFLVLMGSILPGHDLGVAIILLTLAVKIILFIPTQKSLEGQKKMQLLQPQIEALRKKHADDAVKMNQEIMKVWKENKINPFQSCLPLLLQFPVLIGLYHVIRDTQDLALSQHLLYAAFQNLPWTFDTMFLGLNLTMTYALLFAPLLVVLQFIQMKLTFYIADKKKAKKIDEAVHQPDNPQDMQQKIMLYVLPLMIGFFAWKVPSAVSLYWGISTLFAIGQQLIVNREHLKVRS